ncbi:MAG: MarR family transcriptional regulator [Chitinophagales bacterium]|nr:MarR family transcriptional regulator [Chitinophagales bacterium]
MSIPLGKNFSLLTKYYIGIVSKKLYDLEIERYYYALIVIQESENSICQKELAEGIGADNVTMVRIVDYLSDKGFIKRIQSKEDRRYYHLVLTEKAQKTLPKIKAAFDAANAICFSGFKKNEKEEFQRMLLKMQDNLHHHPRVEVNLNFKKIK